MSNLNVQEALDLLLKGTVTCHSVDQLRTLLASGKKLRIKAGFDPTAPDLHLGHGVLLRKMAQFQRLGHTVIFLIGDFTGMIGDPTGKKLTRPPLSREQIQANAETYKAQVFKILDPERTEIRFNDEWLGQLKGEAWIRLAAKFTLAQLLERNDFQKRMAASESISFHELLYPIAQAYDSVALECDAELGGNDQLFNLMRGRDLMGAMGQAPQVVLTVPLLLGMDGVEKMSKSLGNYIGFFEGPDDQFGKAMSISDELMWSWWLLLTDRLPREIEAMRQGHPMDAKKALAREIVGQFHGPTEAVAAEDRWVRRFSERRQDASTALPREVLPATDETLARLLVREGHYPSNKEAQRKIGEGAVWINGEKVGDAQLRLTLAPGEALLVKVGKLGLHKWIVKEPGP
jgi:tyrosyl-tRNA synthetase